MSNSWFRMYHEARHNAKLQRLPAPMFKAWFNLVCQASANESNRGALPPIEDCAYDLRMTVAKAEAVIATLVIARLFEWRDGICYVHDWDTRQFQSDGSSERVKRFRNGKRNIPVTVSETPPDTDTDTDTDTDSPRPPLGEFQSVVLSEDEERKLRIRLNSRFEQYIARLDRYSQTSPAKFRKYKSHYAVILTWADKDGEVRSDQPDIIV